MEIVYPDNVADEQRLIVAIKAKVDADGPTGECAPFITAQGIKLSVNVTKMALAVTHQNNFNNFIFLKEENNQNGNKIHSDITHDVRGIAQFLKKFYAPIYTTLGEWGIPVNAPAEVVIPTDLGDLVIMLGKIITKNEGFSGTTSPIHYYLIEKNLTLSDMADSLNDAVTFKNNAHQNFLDSMLEMSLRNSDSAQTVIDIHKLGGILHVIHETDARALGRYGITTSDAPSTEKDQISEIEISSQKTLQHIVLGSILRSLVDFDLLVYQGRDATGTPETLPAHGELGMTKGHSTITLVNPDSLKVGIVKVRVRR